MEDEKDLLRRAIARIPSPRRKLQLLVKHGLLAEVGALVKKLAREHPVSFLIVNGYYTEGLALFAPPNPPFNGIRTEPRAKRLWMRLETDPDPETSTLLTLDIDGMAAHFGEEQTAITELLYTTFLAIVSREPRPEDWEAHRDSLEWAYARHSAVGEAGFPTYLMDSWLTCALLRTPKAMEEIINQEAASGGAEDVARALKQIDGRLAAGGWGIDQIKKEMFGLLCRTIARTDLPSRHALVYVLGIAGYMNGKNYLGREMGALLHGDYLPTVWTACLAGAQAPAKQTLGYIEGLGRFGLWGSQPALRGQEKSFIRQGLVTLIALGMPTRAHQLLIAFGETWSGRSWFERRSEHAASLLHALLPEAFAQAFRTGSYGIAAALLHQFGRERCEGDPASWMKPPDDTTTEAATTEEDPLKIARKEHAEALDTVTQLAIALEQPIRLELTP